MTGPPGEPAAPLDGTAGHVPAPAGAPGWGTGDIFAAAGVGYLASVLVAVVWSVAAGNTRITWGLVIASTLALWVGFAGYPWWVSRRKGTGSLAADFGFRVERSDLGIGIVAALVVQFVVLNLVAAGFELIEPDVTVSQESQELAERVDAVRFAVLAVVFAVGAPLAEELFFRGLLLRAVARRWGSTVGIVASGLVFGLVHAEGSTAASVGTIVVGLTIFGLVLAWLTERRGRMGPAIVAHVAFNVVAVVGLWLGR